MTRRSQGRRRLIFLHGYTTAWPKAPVWTRLLAEVGLGDVEVDAPAAPRGVARRDAFNPRGLPSWFRYSTDHSAEVPQRFDAPDAGDLDSLLSGPGSLYDSLRSAARDCGGAHRLALVGESQGGVVAAALAMRWNLEHPGDQLGAVGLLRTAPDPSTWSGGAPARFDTRFQVLLGALDATFRPTFSIHALEPLLRCNPSASTEVPSPYRQHDGNVRLEVLPGVEHGTANRAVYRRYVQLLAQDWPPVGG